eukprot:CAMPEP_0194526578 /NCGR_PEP_ID=MMETSP0253-20130528/62434_1 /TAXON_ID=2966 /ORGANISM="Noctiluca scintillans" /LENGTH=154 /DNA_ID=CAMNT_0039371417 /DNA_START=24 /DNA_END=489 /DNA_ORIENTATION=+
MTEVRGPPEIKGMFSLKVDISGKPPSTWNPDDLRELFQQFGEVGDVFIPRTKYSERQCGFAFVRFCSELDGAEAIRKIHGYKLEGSTLSDLERSTAEATDSVRELRTVVEVPSAGGLAGLPVDVEAVNAAVDEAAVGAVAAGRSREGRTVRLVD